VLLRFAFATRDEKCIKALESMKVPAAAIPMFTEMFLDVGLAAVEGRPAVIKPADRERLAALVGSDAGPRVPDWYPLLDDPTRWTIPTPLNAANAAEVDQILQAFAKYFDARLSLSHAGFHSADVALPDWNVVTTAELEQQVDTYVAAVNARVHPATQPAGAR
jgi:hypothetical protein